MHQKNFSRSLSCSLSTVANWIFSVQLLYFDGEGKKRMLTAHNDLGRAKSTDSFYSLFYFAGNCR